MPHHNAADVRYVLTDKGRRDLAEALAQEAELYDLCRHQYGLRRVIVNGRPTAVMACENCGDRKRLPRGEHRSAAAK